MSAVERYTVMTTGAVEPGFNKDQVAEAFVGLMHLTREMADSFVESKMCVASDLNEQRANDYLQSLSEIGLSVVLVPADKQSAELPKFNNQLDNSQLGDQHSLNNFDSSKEFVVPLEHELVDDPYLQVSKPRKTNRIYSLIALGVIVTLAAGFFAYKKVPTGVEAELITLESYKPEIKSGEQIETLLSVLGVQEDFAHFSNFIKTTHTQYLDEKKRKSTTLTNEKYDDLMQLVPRAYNPEALKTVMGNRLQQAAFESDLIDLIALFQTPIVRQYVSLTTAKNPLSDPQGYESFKASLDITPLSENRIQAIADFVDTLGLDDAAFEIAADLQRTLIANAGELRPDKKTTAAKAQIREQIKAMRVTVSRTKPAIRNDVITTLAWQYADVDTGKLRDLQKAMNRYIVRNYIRAMTDGYENYLLQSSMWLHRQLDD